MARNALHRLVLAVAALVVSSLALAGCVHAGAGAWPVLVLASVLSLVGIAACGGGSVPNDASLDATPDLALDATPDGGGTWEPCCENGMVTSCYCMPGWSCNYGQFLVYCGGGTCVNNPDPWDSTPCDLWDDGPLDQGADAALDQGDPP